MTTILMLGAGLLHASWHAVIKSGADRIVLLAGLSLVAGFIAACAIPWVAFPSPAVWMVIAASVVLHVGYKLALARTYAIAGLGQAFPLARGFVPLFATLIAFIGLGELPGPSQLVGVALVSAGLLWLAYEALRDGIDRWVIVAACIAGSTVAGYTALDAYGTRLAQDWATFTVWLIVSDCAAFVVLVRIMQGRELWADILQVRGPVLASGLLGIASFTVFLWALSRAPVGLVSALRESSVLFASLIGILFLGETVSLFRIGAALVIMVGLFVVATGY